MDRALFCRVEDETIDVFGQAREIESGQVSIHRQDDPRSFFIRLIAEGIAHVGQRDGCEVCRRDAAHIIGTEQNLGGSKFVRDKGKLEVNFGIVRPIGLSSSTRLINLHRNFPSLLSALYIASPACQETFQAILCLSLWPGWGQQQQSARMAMITNDTTIQLE